MGLSSSRQWAERRLLRRHPRLSPHLPCADPRAQRGDSLYRRRRGRPCSTHPRRVPCRSNPTGCADAPGPGHHHPWPGRICAPSRTALAHRGRVGDRIRRGVFSNGRLAQVLGLSSGRSRGTAISISVASIGLGVFLGSSVAGILSEPAGFLGLILFGAICEAVPFRWLSPFSAAQRRPNSIRSVSILHCIDEALPFDAAPKRPGNGQPWARSSAVRAGDS